MRRRQACTTAAAASGGDRRGKQQVGRADDGRAYGADDFDGEATVLEKDGEHVLVASESGPSVSRFNVVTGKMVADFPVPERFRTSGKGDAAANAIFESMALSPDGRHLYVGLEEPLRGDGSNQGRELIRILRYTQGPGGQYVPDAQFAYETDSGLRLADLTTVGNDRFLALERGYTEGQGNSVHICEISFAGLPDVSSAESLATEQSVAFIPKTEVVDVGKCPPSGATSKQTQANPLLENAEGMALGPRLTQGAYDGRRPLYLVTDDNNSAEQTTRFYALAVTGL
ncbi:hypothetical protein GCM10023080_074550 [Streptomyces pseudoechinosporeus]